MWLMNFFFLLYDVDCQKTTSHLFVIDTSVWVPLRNLNYKPKYKLSLNYNLRYADFVFQTRTHFFQQI